MLPALVASLVLSAAPGPRILTAVNFGMNEVVALPQPAHVGLYGYAAGSLIWVFDGFTITPSFGAEWSPELRRWGFVASLGTSISLTERLGLDLAARFIHDQAGDDWSRADYLLGAGVGVSFVLRDVILSPSLNGYRALSSPGWVFVPALNFAYVF
jgi:hypothetical protein